MPNPTVLIAAWNYGDGRSIAFASNHGPPIGRSRPSSNGRATPPPGKTSPTGPIENGAKS